MESARTKWERMDWAFHRDEELPPVEPYRIGEQYFALDGNHRISVARYHGVEWIDAEVTEFHVRSPKERGRSDDSPERGEPKVYEMMDPQLVKQRQEELLREAEQNRLARALRDSRKRRGVGLASALVWESKRVAGRLRKLLRTSKDAG